jgi:hypothetical protein
MNKKFSIAFRLSLNIAAISMAIVILIEYFLDVDFTFQWVLLHTGIFVAIFLCCWIVLEALVFRKIRSIFNKVDSQLSSSLKSQTPSLLGSLPAKCRYTYRRTEK